MASDTSWKHPCLLCSLNDMKGRLCGFNQGPIFKSETGDIVHSAQGVKDHRIGFLVWLFSLKSEKV